MKLRMTRMVAGIAGGVVLGSVLAATAAYAAGPVGKLAPMGKPAVTQTFQDFAYTVTDGKVTITKYKGSAGEVTVPGTIDGLPVTGIGELAFFARTGLTALTLPESLTSIGDMALAGCSKLTQVNLPPHLTSLGMQAFLQCGSLTSITIPGGVECIGKQTFSGCGALVNVTITHGVTTIREQAFAGCKGLLQITLPASVITLGTGAFDDCTGLTAYTVEAGNPVFSSAAGALLNQPQTQVLRYPMGKAGSYSVPATVTAIGPQAFAGCVKLSDITLPDTLTTIGREAFAGCSELTSVTLPKLLTCLGYDAFAQCPKLTKATQEKIAACYIRVDGVLFNKSQTVLLAYPREKNGNYSIPKTVTSLGEGAFRGATGLTGITMHSLTTLPDETFAGCTNLTYVALPNTLTSLGQRAFYECVKLNNINLPGSVTSIGPEAFSGGAALVTITIPDRVTSIGENAFAYCPALKEVNFLGPAPKVKGGLFQGSENATVYYLANTKGWGPTLGGRRTELAKPANDRH